MTKITVKYFLKRLNNFKMSYIEKCVLLTGDLEVSFSIVFEFFRTRPRCCFFFSRAQESTLFKLSEFEDPSLCWEHKQLRLFCHNTTKMHPLLTRPC